ncbi:HlyD family secretion protein [Mesorhizobium sp. B2-4-17]|uniref:HlyD family secretion protein n=1 Tax=Mesorhizobium sp. B2-4-17 TaxID=2589932 RepID=UPI001FEE3D37|nr:HlyD family secretion protein [Mesorhizobium sp. B2-4-17]
MSASSKTLPLRIAVLLLAAGVVFLFTMNWNAWTGSARTQSTDDAYLESDITPLAARVSGYVRSVAVKDFQRVKAGDLLVQIEDDDYSALVDQSEANVEAGKAAIANVENQKILQQALIRQAEATIAATESDVWRYERDSKRYQSLLTTDAVSHQAAEQALNSYSRATATLALNHAQFDQQRQQLKVLDTQQQQAEATLKAQKAALTLARFNLGHTRILAPADGMVGLRQVRPGQYVGIGTQVISIVPLPDIWVVANYKETQLTRVRVGQAAAVTVDSVPGVVLKGRVDSWSPATGSRFSLLPPDNATGNFTKVVQRIPVKIVLDHDSSQLELLRPGMSVTATVDTGGTSEGGRAAADGLP